MNKQIKGKRFNKGKLRYELISNIALKELAKVYTNGAEKYTEYDDDGNMIFDGSNNWKNGLLWMDCIASAKRHIEKFIEGTDVDEETNTLHLANACWNLMTIVDFYKSFPQGDDRYKKFLNRPKVGLDVDGVLADFSGSWSNLYPDINPKPESWYLDRKIKERFVKMIDEGTLNDFYLNLGKLINAKDMLFEPHCYITSRPVPTEITEKWIDFNGFPAKPIYTVDIGKSKVEVAKESGIDIFIDDSYENFVDLNNNGIFTYLYTTSWNKKYDVGNMRIDFLNEIPMFK